MDSRSALHALASAKLHASRRKLGWSALGLLALMALLAGARESAVDTLAAWLSGIGAFFCFARYAGDSKEIERLEQWRAAPPPSRPLHPVTTHDETLINTYGRVLLRSVGKALIPLSKLPSSKRRLKLALAAGIQQTTSPEDRLILEEGYLSLSRFQPLSDNNFDLPIAASAEEYLCLTQELAAFRSPDAT